MAPRAPRVLAALFGVANADLAIKVEQVSGATAGMVTYMPSGGCAADSETGTIASFSKMTCNAAKTELTIEKFPSSDADCATTPDSSATQALPFSSGQHTLSCEDVTSSGQVVLKSYNNSGCSEHLCDMQVQLTDVCSKFGQAVNGGNGLSFKSMLTTQKGQYVMFASEDCTGVPMIGGRSDTCAADADACNGAGGFSMFIATSNGGTAVTLTMPEQAKMLLKVNGAYMPAGKCKPSFDGNTNTIAAYEKMYCHDASTIIHETYGATDSDCSGALHSLVPMPVPNANMPGMSCVADTSTGTLTTKKFKAAGCASGDLCGVSHMVAGMCTAFPTPVDIGGTNANSMMYDNNFMANYYESNDCSDAAFISTGAPAAGCQSDATDTCNDGTTPAWAHVTADAAVVETTVAATTVAETTVAATTVAETTVAATTVAETTVAATTVAPTTVAPNTGSDSNSNSNNSSNSNNNTDTAANTTVAPATTVAATETAAPSAVASGALSQEGFMVFVSAFALASAQFSL